MAFSLRLEDRSASHKAARQPRDTVSERCSLDRMLIYSPRHLLGILGEFVAHYDEHRPHQGRHQRPPNATDTTPVGVVDFAATRIRRRKILNGLINEYSQAA
jgi:putative transposase